ncbi:phosphoglycerate mutase [Kocuria flava]|uniref:Phosphoglycerate mutase n=1 Tax=Kocuria flava TaxID=446860 RepID=A0A2N4SYQ2_9MICC|nr:histidine phosphatase family protein [Kocuria flava]PLC11069.1 phosphoglycerate mutase [Kocuria flava]
MTNPGRIVLIRHGQTDWNLAERLQGAVDVPLNDTGRHQAREAGRLLREQALPWDVLVSSPLGRAVETARLIGEALGLEPAGTYPELTERGFGRHEGTSYAGLGPAEREALMGAGEPAGAVARRGLAALHRIRREHPGRHVLVVAHGSLIRLTLSHLHGRAHPRIGNCEVVPVGVEALAAAHEAAADTPDTALPVQ